MADLFKTAPAEVVRYFETKRSTPSFDWRDIAPEEHAFSWTVAKSAGFDVLDDIRTAVSDAITNRVPFETFRDQLTPVLQAKGWWGRTTAIDPQTGETVDVQLGSPRRLKTIYWANMRTAHAAGEWERTERNKAFLPFLIYTLSHAEQKRAEHVGWVGTILPVDDPWWHTHYPPNGWLCKCGVRQISRAEALRSGYDPAKGAPAVETRRMLNTRTGEWSDIPVGIDPGWDTNPGRGRSGNVSRLLFEQVDAMPAHRQAAAIADISGSPILDAMARGKARPGTFLPVMQLPSRVPATVGAQTGLVRLSTTSLQHILLDHPQRALAIADVRTALTVARNPEAIVRGDRGVILLGQVGGVWWRVVAKAANDGREWWLVSFHRKSEKEARRAIARAALAGNLIE